MPATPTVFLRRHGRLLRSTVAAVLLVAQLAATASAADGAFLQHDPPSSKDALRLIFHNARLLLPDNDACRNVDTSGLPDPTLGDWLAGILAEFPPAEGRSGVEASCEGELGALSCAVHVQRQSGEEVWSWGLRFVADGRSGRIDPMSIVCDASG